MKLTKDEVDYLVSLLVAEKETISFLRGFGKPTKTEKQEGAKYEKLISKLRNL